MGERLGGREREVVREVSYGGISLWSLGKQGFVLFCLYPPTLEEASVRELRVLDLPALGLPTRPMRGSRGMVDVCQIWWEGGFVFRVYIRRWGRY